MPEVIVYQPDTIADPYVYGFADNRVVWGPKREGALRFPSELQARMELWTYPNAKPNTYTYAPTHQAVQKAKPKLVHTA